MKRIAKYFSNVFWHLAFISGPIFLIVWICLLAWLLPIFSEMSPKNANRQNLVYWFLIRDFERLSDENRLALAECYLSEFGSRSGNSVPEFEFSDFVQKQVVKIEAARSERTKQEVKVAKEPEKLLAIKVPQPERNVKLLAKAWFFDQMQKYENADFNTKKELLSQMVVEIKWWQNYNTEYLLAASVKPSGLTESLQQLEMIFARWEAESSPEDRKRIAAFKPRVTGALVNDGVSEALGGDVSKTIGGVMSLFSRPKKNDQKTGSTKKSTSPSDEIAP